MRRELQQGCLAILMCFAVLFCTGCQESDTPAEEVTPVETQAPASSESSSEPEVVLPAVEPEPVIQTKNVRLRAKDSSEYRDVSLKKGDTIDIPTRSGYTFRGYWDDINGKESSDSIQYIDETGTMIRDYSGIEQLVLYARYTADEYDVVLYKDGKPLSGTNKIGCNYDKNFLKDLPLGREFRKNLKNDHENSYVITGFADAEGTSVIVPNSSKLTVQMLEKYVGVVDHENKTATLNVLTEDTHYFKQLTSLDDKIGNKGLLKQSLHQTQDAQESTYYVFDMSGNTDAEALKKLGYQTAKIKMTVQLDMGKGRPRICVTAKPVNKEGEAKGNNALFDTLVSKKDVKGEDGGDTMYEASFEKPIDSMTNKLYVYCNSEWPIEQEWTVKLVSMEVQFVK